MCYEVLLFLVPFCSHDLISIFLPLNLPVAYNSSVHCTQVSDQCPLGLSFDYLFNTARGIWRYLAESKYSATNTKCMFFPMKIASLASNWLRRFRLLLHKHGTKFDKNDRKHVPKMIVTSVADLLRHFQLLLCNRWTKYEEFDRKQVLKVKVCVFPLIDQRKVWPLFIWEKGRDLTQSYEKKNPYTHRKIKK